MDKVQRFFFVETPNDSVIHLKNVAVGENVDIRPSLDGSEMFVKTNGFLINKEVKKGVKLNKIFPPGLTTEVTYLQAHERVTSSLYQSLIV